MREDVEMKTHASSDPYDMTSWDAREAEADKY